ncbi:MAG: ATP-binding protein [Bacteroidota bacterium]
MAYKRVTLSALVSTGVIVSSVFIAGYFTALKTDPWYLLFLLPVPIAAFSIINTFNQSNRQIAFFFDAIRNEDSSLKFPVSIRQKSLRHLYQSLNHLNERINEIKLHNEYLEKYYQSFIQHASTGLMAVNRNNEVEIMNDKAFEYAGIPSFTPLHLVPLRNPELFQVLATISPGEAFTFKRLMGDTPINLVIRSREIRFGENVSRLISLQDIRHELDEKELDSWQKLIRVLTHEIMNSIAPIVSLTGTLKKFFPRDGLASASSSVDAETIENLIQGLETIEERGNGLVSFVNSYRILTKIPKPDFSVFQVEEWLEQIGLLLHEQIEKQGINLEIKIDQRAGELTGDKNLLTQVVLNILKNATEALAEIPENRKIRIVADISRQNRPVIRISNNGPVISEDVLEKIFIPFFTTREQGSGIGLSLSREILRLHHGSIHAESTEAATSFIITL